MVVRAAFEPDRIASTAGASALTLRLHNDASGRNQFRLKPIGELALRTVLQTDTINLDPGEQFEVPVLVETDQQLAAGSHMCAVEVSSDDGAHLVAQATLDVEAHATCTVSLIPERSRSATVGRHRIRIDNKGNVAVRVDALPSPANRADQQPSTGADGETQPSAFVELAAPTVTVEPFQTGRIDVRVRPYDTFWTGSSRLHDYQINAAASSGETFLLVGQYEQLPRVRQWLVGALAGAFLALLLGTLAWFILLRPAVENIAEDAASEAAAANRAIIDDKLAEVEQAAAEAAELPLGQPIDLRLAVSPGIAATAVDAVPVGVGRTVSVTDVVFQNPTGAVGTVTLLRDGETLLESQLANFRDLDFHFVSALQFEGPTSIELAVTCTETGPAQEDCPVGATLTGFVDEG